MTRYKNPVEWAQFVKQIKGLARGSLWRHNQAGDLNGIGEDIDTAKLADLVQANKGKRGFTINLSGNNIAHADKLKALNVGPVVVMMPRDADKVTLTPAGNKVVICPAENTDKVNCLKCGICQHAKRDYIIGFRAHGTAAKTVEVIARG